MTLNINLVTGNDSNSSIETNYQASTIVSTVKFFSKTKILLVRKRHGNPLSNSIRTKIKP